MRSIVSEFLYKKSTPDRVDFCIKVDYIAFCIRLFFLEEVSDLDEELYISRSYWSGWSWSLFWHSSIHGFHHEEYTERHDDEVEGDSDEVTPCNHSPNLLGICECTDDERIPEVVVHIREVYTTTDLADDRHDDIFHDRGDNLTERCTDDHTYSKIDYITFHCEVSELFYYTHRKIGKKNNIVYTLEYKHK